MERGSAPVWQNANNCTADQINAREAIRDAVKRQLK